MKKYRIILAGVAAMALMGSCSEERFDTTGEGAITLTTKINTDMTVVSRSLADDLAESTIIWISNDKGAIRKYNGASEIPTGEIPLLSGSYVAQVWAGDSVSASFEQRCFKGREAFTVSAGQTSRVEITAKLANVAASVVYDEGVDEVLRNYSMTVGHDRGELVFEGRDERRGYFMMPSTSDDLTYTLEGELNDGTPFVLQGTIADAKSHPATEYVLHVKYDAETPDLGGGVFTITVDETSIEIQDTIEIITAPIFSGYGFDFENPIRSKAGEVGRLTVYASSATEITALEMDSKLFEPIVDGNGVELFGMADTQRQKLIDAGINYTLNYDAEADNSLLQVNFEESLTNALLDGTHEIVFRAKDRDGRTSEVTLTIVISDNPVSIEPVNENEVYSNRATLRALVTKENVETIGFNYRKSGDADWTFVEGIAGSRTYAVGTPYYAVIENLEPGTDYEYVANDGTFATSEINKFTTELQAQLPNAGMEDWAEFRSGEDTKDVVHIAADASSMFWDSGNHGSATMGKSVTNKSADIKHSGNYSACLESQFVGLGGVVGKFAAGNLFVGQYLHTAGTDGVLGWGRPFNCRPTALKVWVKYEPAQVTEKKEAHADLAVGDMDRGVIYIALLDETTKADANYPGWPIVIKTASKEQQLFSPDDANVIAYGRHDFNEATAGSDMVEITIPIDYKKDIRPSNIAIVCSASVYGDYFAGGRGSKMYVDDFELVY